MVTPCACEGNELIGASDYGPSARQALRQDWLEPAAANALAIDQGYWTEANLPYGVADLVGDGHLSVAVVRDMPGATEMVLPAVACHIITVPLDVEVHKDIAWDDFRFTGRLRRGDISLLPAGLAGRTSYSGRYTEALNIFLRPSLLEKLQDEEWERPPVIPVNGARAILFRDPWLTELATRIGDEIANRRPGRRLIAESLATAFATSLLRIMAQADAQPMPTIKSDSVAHRHVRRAIEFMHANLSNDIGLSDLAEAADCTVERLKFAFREHAGEPPYHHLLMIRIERARHLLAHSSMAIADIAAQCGFNDQAHFTTAFARATSCTPGRWRRENGKSFKGA